MNKDKHVMKIYQVDAFANSAFKGNPAAVVPLQSWLDDTVMQAIAEENNLSETAFYVPSEKGFELRWFTPTSEVKLCGHATLATAHVIFKQLGDVGKTLCFETASGDLYVSQTAQGYAINFPAQPGTPSGITMNMRGALGIDSSPCMRSEDYIIILPTEAHVKAVKPDFTALQREDLRGVIITAPGDEYDFVARFFGPKVGVPEDPVTGSAFTQLIPYWANRLEKTSLRGCQVSARPGLVECEYLGDRVTIAGQAHTYLVGEIYI